MSRGEPDLAPERVVGLRSPELRTPSWARDLGPGLAWHGCALLPGVGEPGWAAWPEGNRSLVLPELRLRHAGRDWMLSVKGVGARHPMFGEARSVVRFFSRESWFGEAPWGAQGDEGVRTSLEVTEEAEGASLFGMPICPLLAAVRLPEERVAQAIPATWRRYAGCFWQEHRLVPSRIRLGDQSELTLAFDPEGALRRLGVAGVPALDAFIDRLLATGLAALTLASRSAVRGPRGVTGYAFAHVWLDKDAVVAPDGALCFADLEGLDRVILPDLEALQVLARRQLDDHVYELLYAVDRLLHLRERWRDRPLDPASRRRDLALRTELALAGDPFMEALPRADGLDLLLRAPAWPERPFTLPFLYG